MINRLHKIDLSHWEIDDWADRFRDEFQAFSKTEMFEAITRELIGEAIEQFVNSEQVFSAVITADGIRLDAEELDDDYALIHWDNIDIADDAIAVLRNKIKQNADAAHDLLLHKKLLVKVESLALPTRTHHAMRDDDIIYVADLVQKTEAEMLRTPNFGRKSFDAVKAILTAMGLSFDMTLKNWHRPPPPVSPPPLESGQIEPALGVKPCRVCHYLKPLWLAYRDCPSGIEYVCQDCAASVGVWDHWDAANA
jgi:hypothetical protein